MKSLQALFLITAMLAASTSRALSQNESQPIVIAKQGSFSVGGNKLLRPGTFDNHKFVGWATQAEEGQSYRGDHAYVEYQIPLHAKHLPLIFVHGYGGSGACWQTTPDGRDGFQTLMLRRGYDTYVMDLPGRGRASRTTATVTAKPVADEMFWFDVWRMGQWPRWNNGVQFPKDSASLSQFFRLMVPNLSDGKGDVSAINNVVEKVGDNILVTHSAGGVLGWFAGLNPHVRAIVAYEPGAFVFPEGEVPAKIDGLTGGTEGIALPKAQFEQLTKKPMVLYFGDYIPETVTNNLGDENWRVRLQMARLFVEAVNRHGGNATLVELPKEGIRGNTHFLMLDLNNDVLASHLEKWLEKNGLSAPGDISFPVGRKLPSPPFTGNAYNANLIQMGQAGRFPEANNIVFQPGAHSGWHVHGGMVVLVTGGVGIYQEEGKPAQVIRKGDVVEIPAGVRHWHGATKDSWFSQMVIYDKQWNDKKAMAKTAKLDNRVTDEYYQQLDLVEYEGRKPHSDSLMFAKGDKPLQLPTFNGTVYLSEVLPHNNAANSPALNYVVFEPGCVNQWHTHEGGQVLIATDGIGFHQIEGQPVQVMRPGDVAYCPPGVRHWHGAAKGSRFAHLAAHANPEKPKVQWFSFIDKREYDKLPN